jgi:hypothetical protein
MAAYTTIDNPELYFQTVLYTGNGAANHAITLDGDEDMAPSFVWIKNRDATDQHCLFDSVRGATQLLVTSEGDPASAAAEVTDADTLDSFTSDGFQVDADVKVNTNTEKYVAWCWKGGTSGTDISGGTIASTGYNYNATSGFSIFEHDGTGSNGTIAHGLGVAPQMLLLKRVDDVGDWQTGHSGFTSWVYQLGINTTTAQASSATVWNSTAPDATVISVGTSGGSNYSGRSYVTYAFAPVQGYSKFGSYTGNGNADGPFVYTGFRPAFLLIKSSSNSGTAWQMWDNKRAVPFNPITTWDLAANNNTAEDTIAAGVVDFLSNGFKMRKVGNDNNGSGLTYIYAAFAEAPLVNSEGVPCNAR